ncbi:MAG: hypothetical protein ACK5TO_11415, partial [Planctomycetaceae bacterium]
MARPDWLTASRSGSSAVAGRRGGPGFFAPPPPPPHATLPPVRGCAWSVVRRLVFRGEVTDETTS